MAKKTKVLLCGIGRRENKYIREWIEYNKKVGFTHINLYDNNREGEERFTDVIQDYVDSGFVTIIDWSKYSDKAQYSAYQDCYDNYHSQYDWIAYFDIDEFLEVDSNKFANVSDFVDSFPEDINNIRIAWEPYGDNDLCKVEDGNYSVVERFTTPLPQDKGIDYVVTKAIIRTNIPNFKLSNGDAAEHMINYSGMSAMDTEYNKWWDNSNIRAKKINLVGAKLKHYRTKTIQELLESKVSRGYICATNSFSNSNNFFMLCNASAYIRMNSEKFAFCKEYFSYMKHKDITCCILNYKHNENALRWYNMCKDFYSTYIIDTYTLDNEDDDKLACLCDPRIIECHNLYFGGGRIKAYEMMVKDNAKWLITITGDAEINNWNFFLFINSVHADIYGHEDELGCVYGGADMESTCMGTNKVNIRNRHEFTVRNGRLRNVMGCEEWVSINSREVCDKVFPKLDYDENKYGWGIGSLLDGIARQNGKRVCVDDAFAIHHPEGTGYSGELADAEYTLFRQKFGPVFGLKPRVAIVTIVKNENKYLKEWVEYYKNLGVTNIYIYDNNDKDGEKPEDVIQDYINSGLVVMRPVRGQRPTASNSIQLAAYQELYGYFSLDYDWFGFLDADEFITMKDFDNLPDFLAQKKFNIYDMIHINWMNYGDSDALSLPENGVLANLTVPCDYKLSTQYEGKPDNNHVKSFIRGGFRGLSWTNPHTISDSHKLCCNPIGEQVTADSPFQAYNFDEAYIKHFQLKTVNDLCVKIERGYPDATMMDLNVRTKELIKRFFQQNKTTPEKLNILQGWIDKHNQKVREAKEARATAETNNENKEKGEA